MSICANIFVLFKTTPAARRVREIEVDIIKKIGHAPWTFDGLDVGFLQSYSGEMDELSFDVAGHIEQLRRPRSGLLPGPVSAERFFHISYLSRWWSETYPDGPMTKYGETMLTLLAQPEVEMVWFAPDEWGAIDALTASEIHAMISKHQHLINNSLPEP